MKTDHLIGDWSSILEKEFTQPYMKEISSTITKLRSNPFSKILPEKPLSCLKTTPLNNLKVIYVIDCLKSARLVNYQIEKEIFNGFSILLSMEESVDWLNSQGILILPRCLTYDLEEAHKIWIPFTNKVIEEAIKYNDKILIVSDDNEIIDFVKDITPNFISGGFGSWKVIKSYCKDNFTDQIVWEPIPF